MKPTNEAGQVRAIVAALHREYGDEIVAYKIHGSAMQQVGIPDLLLCVRGTFVALEVKHRRPGESADYARGRVSLTQQRQIDRLRAAGAVAEVVLAPDEALAVVERALLVDPQA